MAKMKTAILLKIALLLVVFSRVDSYYDMKSKHVCEGEILRLDCGDDFIKVSSALYGRADPTICEDDEDNNQDDGATPFGTAHCRADKSNFEAIRHCDGSKNCEIPASNTVFGDSSCAGGVKKYLQVNYYCSSQIPSTCNARDSPTYRTAYGCDNTDLELECPNPGEVIKILDANYGRQGSDAVINCPYRPNIDDIFCDDDTGESFERVCLQCRGKDECTIPISTKDFKDHCVNTNKYLSVQYVCISTEPDSEEEDDDEDDEEETPTQPRGDSEIPEEPLSLPPRRPPGDSPAMEATTVPQRRPGDSPVMEATTVPQRRPGDSVVVEAPIAPQRPRPEAGDSPVQVTTVPQRRPGDSPIQVTTAPQRRPGDADVVKVPTGPQRPLFPFFALPPKSAIGGKIGSVTKKPDEKYFVLNGNTQVNERGDLPITEASAVPQKPFIPFKPFFFGPPKQAAGGGIGSVTKKPEKSSFIWNGNTQVNGNPALFIPRPGEGAQGGSIISDTSGSAGSSFKWVGGAAVKGTNKYQGFIGQTRPDGSKRTFTWGGNPVSGVTSLFQPVAVSPGSSEMFMKIIVTTDSSGQRFFTLQPFQGSQTQVDATGGSGYIMKIDTNKMQEYMQQSTFVQLIQEYNRGTTFYNREEEMNKPFQFTVGNGLKAFFPSIFQMITEVDSVTGKTVTKPTSSSSNFQVILDGGNKQIVEYLIGFASLDQTQRSELIDYNLQIPMKFYNEQTKKIEEIKIPFYANYNGMATALSQIFGSTAKPASQFGMKFQIANEKGSNELITLPFTMIENAGKKLMFLTLPTCVAYKMYGFADDGEYLIDPDGINEGVEPFVVNCNMKKSETIINHNRREYTVASYPAGQDRLNVDITYDGATEAQQAALRSVSESCHQMLKHECNKRSWHFKDGAAKIWWESPDGKKRENWGGVATGVSKCHCGLQDACLVKGEVCNCDNGEGTSDWGEITDKDTLPVRRVVVAGEQAQDKLQVGPFKCKGDQSSGTLQFTIMLAQMLAKPQMTCNDYKKNGYEMDGMYLIDPDGGEKPFTGGEKPSTGGEKPFTVFCDMEKQHNGVTVVHHELSNQRTKVKGFEEPGSYSMDIKYKATLRQIANLKYVSGACEQSLSYECQGSAFHVNGVLNHWWMSFDDEKMLNWGGAPCDFHECGCKVNSTCVDNLSCNCDKKDGILRTDSGILDDKDKLPVSQLRFGDTGESNEEGYYTLGPLRCWDDSGRRPKYHATLSSCTEIKKFDTAARSGNYYIQPTQSVKPFLVYCDMSDPEAQEQDDIGRQLSKEPACKEITTIASGNFQTETPDLNEFVFSVKTSGTAILKISPIDVPDSAQLIIEIGTDNSVHLSSCSFNNDCTRTPPQSFSGTVSQTRTFTLSVKLPEIRLTQGQETLTFTTSNDMVTKYLGFKTTGDNGTWKLNCINPVFTKDICEGQGHISCPLPKKIHMEVFYGRMNNDACRNPNDTFKITEACYINVTKSMKHMCTTKGISKCFFQLGRYRNMKSESGCKFVNAYLHIKYECKDAAEIQNIGKSLGPCSSNPCLNGECEEVNNQNSYVCSCPKKFEGDHCQTEMVTCNAIGDPHYEDFAGRFFDFQGGCTYVLARGGCENTDDPDFEVQVVNESPKKNPAVSSTTEVYVNFIDTEIQLKQGKEVYVNEKSYVDIERNFEISETDLHVVVKAPRYGLTVTWNGDDFVEVTVPKGAPGSVCGLCGDTHTDPRSTTFKTNNGQPETNLDTFGNSWKVNSDCVSYTETNNPLNKPADNRMLALAKKFCKAISATDEPFTKCPNTTRRPFKEDCEFDFEQGSNTTACNIIQEYRDSCERENKAEVKFPADWVKSQNSECSADCEEYLTYTNCTRCDGKCSQLLLLGGKNCNGDCMSGCVCPDDLYDDGSSCVKEEECGCSYKGKYYELGSKVMDSNCEEECICEKGNKMLCGLPSNKLCPVHHTDLFYKCEETDGFIDCSCSDGYNPNQDGTSCIAAPKPDTVFPTGRRRRKREATGNECNVKLGMSSGLIPDAHITSSSRRNHDSRAKQARPSLNGWTAKRANTDQWLQVDIRIPTEITGVTTYGGQYEKHGMVKQGWVSAFVADISLDGRSWTAMTTKNGQKQFFGNSDSDTPVTNMFAMTMMARYIRIIPTSWYGSISMRLEIIGCKQVCDAEIGSFPVTRHISSDNWFVVNVGEPINCAGHVTAWKVLHSREEPLEAWVLRPLKRKSHLASFRLVGSSHIPAGPVDKEIQYDLNDQRIPVQFGDVVGFLYDRNPLYSSEEGEETTDFMWIHTRDISNYETMGPGFKLRLSGGPSKRAFSAVAVLEPSNGVSVPSALCVNELGLNQHKKLLLDSAFTASSHTKGHQPHRSRLNTLYKDRKMRSGWSPRRRDRGSYLQVNLGVLQQVSGIITQGRHARQTRPRRRGRRRGAWVSSYFVQFSQDCEHWEYVKTANGKKKRFSGNSDQNTPKTNYLDESIHAQCIRIKPRKYRRKIGLRLELLGCSDDPCVSGPCEQGGTCKQASGLNPDGYVCKCPQGWTGNRCQTPEGMCRSAGDSHYESFDSRHYYFPGECTYTLAKDCSSGDTPTFDVLTNNANTGREIYIYTNEMMFELKQGGIVHVDGEACKLPMKRNGVTAIHNAYTGVFLQTAYGLSVEWDGHHRVIVSLPNSYSGKVCGLCGNFNGDETDDIPQDVSEMQFGEQFALDPKTCGPCQKCTLGKPCDLHPEKLQEALKLCKPITDPLGPFAGCHGIVDPSEIYQDCLQDVCDSNSLSRVPRCTHLSEYADVCAHNGIVITGWRKKNLCGITCPAGMIHTPCGSACPATCGDPHAPKTCTQPCEETCQCPEGLLKEGDKQCVKPSQCGCTDNGCYYEGGSTFYRFGCTERAMCGADGEVSYTPSQCGPNAVCGSRDGVYGCFCKDGFSGDGIDCTNVASDTALLVCEDDVLDLYCGPNKHIDIVEAVYGRMKDVDKCPSKIQPPAGCSAKSSMSAVIAKCQGKESCNLKVTSEVFGDPCFGVSKYLEVDYQCTLTPQPKSTSDEIRKRVCQGDSMEIDCGQLLIEVVDAVYGRLTDGQVCPGGDMESIDCRASTSLTVVQQLCHGKNQCTGLQASNHLFGGNPCTRTSKYLEVWYKCSTSVVPSANLPTSPCSAKPCQHGGECVEAHTETGYKCSCPHDWTGTNCEFEEVTCRAAGVSHFQDFNGQRFEFLGDSKYDLATSCHGNQYDFQVVIKKARLPIQNQVSAIEAVTVSYDNRVLELRQEYKVLLDGKKVSDTMTLNFGKMQLCRVGNYLLLKTDFGMIVAWDGLHQVQVRLPDNVARQTCGLCGTYQGLVADNLGFIDRDGNKVDDVNVFGNSWHVAADAPAFIHTDLITTHPCVVWPNHVYEAVEVHCSELKKELGVFKSCFAKVNPYKFYQNCLYDMCATLPSQEFICQAMAEYADACLDAGVILGNWRASFKGGQCAMECPEGQVYSPCVQSCPKSCGDPHAEDEKVDRCYEGCVCRESGLFQDRDQCLKQTRCGCQRLGVYYQPEERVLSDQCSGQFFCLPGGEWISTPYHCDENAHCGIVEHRQGCICNAYYVGSGKQCLHTQQVSTKVISQGETLHIDCGDLYVDIISADYSYTDRTSTGATTDPDCRSSNELDILSNHITGAGNKLETTVSAYTFGETCSQVNNVLTVQYMCSSQQVVREVEAGKVVHVRGCQERRILLKCRKGSRMKILKAAYGRMTGSEVCHSYSKGVETTSCLAPQKRVMKRVKKRCENRNKCNLHVTKRKLRTDPCENTSKYLDITYKCEVHEPN